MSYRALLFCPDEKTARVVTQVLSELEFQVEPCNEPFAAVKKLMGEHFDALVVDCENEQNASLLFKSAHNSGGNQASLAVAVVEGQSGVAKAFRIGANLVLTKPINVEQSKGTLRVARGLLRKGETAKGTPFAPGKPASLTTAPPTIAPTAAPSTSAFELEKEPMPQPEPAEAALLESMPQPAMPAASQQYSWQPTSQPMAESMSTALKQAGEATTKPSDGSSSATSFVTSVSGSLFGAAQGAGTAAAPAKTASPADNDIDDFEEPTGLSITKVARQAPKPARSYTGLITAVAMIAIAAAGYFAWKKLPAGVLTSLLRKAPSAAVKSPGVPTAPVVSQPAAVIPSPVTVSPAAAGSVPASGAAPTAAVMVPPPAPGTATPGVAPKIQEKAPLTAESIAGAPKKPSPAIESSAANSSVVKTIDEENPSDTLRVAMQAPKKVVTKPAAVEAEEAPAVFSLTSDTSDQTIAGLVSAPARVPKGASQALNVSQGVSQGLLIKKVPPIYPQQAMQMRIQGAVQLMATISKTGNITDLKVQSGDAVLVKAAMDAVKQWKYKPFLLDGQPTDIQTQITINFKLP